jgi:arylsulfatase A
MKDFLLLLLAFATPLLARGSSTPERKPNIVILFADNLGYADLSFFNGDGAAKTPNVDRIGQEGIKLNNWNSVAHLCSASRAALLTGKYPVRTGVYPGVFKPDSVYGMLPTETTLAEYLKDEGYATSIGAG